MHIPMEFLSPQMSGTDSGAGAKASRQSPGKDKNQFNNLLAKELDRHDRKMLNKQKAPKDVRENSGSVWKADGTAAERNSYQKQENYQKEVPKAEDETVLATGATSLITDLLDQEQEFVSILEGEESVTTPKTHADSTVDVPPPEVKQETQPPVKNEPEAENVNVIKAPETGADEKVSVNAIKAPERSIDENFSVNAEAKPGEKPEAENVNVIKAPETGTDEKVSVNAEAKPGEKPEAENVNEIKAPETGTDEKVSVNAEAKPQEPNETSTSTQTQLQAKHPETAEIKDTVSVKQDDVTKTEKAEVTGEVTARKPEVKSETTQTGEKSDDNLNDKGNPRPLENKNETAQVKGSEEKTEPFKAEKIEEEQKTATAAVKEAAAGEKSEKADKEDGKKTTAATQTTAEAPPPFSEGFKAISFRAAQQLARAAYEQPVKPENLFQEMIDKVETMTTQSKSTMTIQLNPEHLGKVALEVALDASGIHVKIKAEDNNIRNMINTQLTALIESLETKGLAVSEVEVVFAGANFDNNFSGNGDGKQDSSDSRPTVKQAKDTKGTIEYYTAITSVMDYYLDAGVSTVEYSA